MKFSVSLILLSIFLVVFVTLNDAHYYRPLIQDVHDKYERDGVAIIASETNYRSFKKITIWHEVARILSGEGIFTRIINFKQFEDGLKSFDDNNIRSLIVIVFDTIEELHTFESLTKDSQIIYTIRLILFTRDASRDVCEFCRNPHRSLSSPKFGAKVLISCCDENMIEEWYTKGNHTEKQELGRLKDGNLGIEWFPKELIHNYKYSKDDRALRIVGVKHAVFFREQDGHYLGLLGEILEEIFQAMNFTLAEITWEDTFGILNPETSNWSGALGRIHRGEADIGVSSFYMTNERKNAVSFTVPFASGFFQLYTRKYDAADLLWDAHFKVFAVNIWMSIIGLILITPILLTLIKYTRKYNFFSLHFEHHLLVWGIYCQQGLSESPKLTSSRIVYISISLSALITSAAYSASIISSSTVSSYKPFSTVEEFVDDGTYQFITLQSTLQDDLYLVPDQSLMKKVMALMKPTDLLPRNNQEAFEQVCSSRVVFYTHEATKKYLLSSIPCEITSTKIGRSEPLSMIMPRTSRYLDNVNHHIQKFKDSGLLRRLEEKYSPEIQHNNQDYPQVQLQEISSIVAILAVGAMIAFIIFIIERNSYPSLRELRNRRRRTTLKKSSVNFRF